MHIPSVGRARAADALGKVSFMRCLRVTALCLAATFASRGAAAVEPYQPQTLAKGVYVFPGSVAAPSPRNGGRVANVGLIVGTNGAIAIGTGSTDKDAEKLLDAIARVTTKPLALAINTYAGSEHVMGNAAFARRGIAILAHRETDHFMVQNCAVCIRNQRAQIGDDAVPHADFQRPTRLVDGSTKIREGGREIEILHFGWAHQPGDIVVFDRASGTLFAGGLVTLDVLPDAHAADVNAWIRALEKLQTLPVRTIVPGSGPPSAPKRLTEVRRYLGELLAGTEAAYANGLSLSEAPQAVSSPDFRHWAMYDTLHGRNVHHAYLALEARELAR